MQALRILPLLMSMLAMVAGKRGTGSAIRTSPAAEIFCVLRCGKN
jgi:hypothetical protein